MMRGALAAALFGIGLLHAAAQASTGSSGRCDAPATNTRTSASLVQLLTEHKPRSGEEKVRAAVPGEVVPKPQGATGNNGKDFNAMLRSLWSASGDCVSVLHEARERITSQGIEMPANGKHEGLKTVEGGSTDVEASHLGHMAQVELERLQKLDGSATMCQTGFNFGNSAVAFLCNTSHAKLFSWDLGEHDYVATARAVVDELFPGRHTLTLGDSTQTLQPEPVTRTLGGRLCDLVFVDGGHTLEVAQADIENFARFAAPNALFIIDDCPPKEQRGKEDKPQQGNQAVGFAFKAAVEKGILVEEDTSATFGTQGHSDSRSICVSRKAS